jgi:hypothetical protein
MDGPSTTRRNAMFHFTFIDEASTENEHEILKKQETARKKAEEQSEEKKDTLQGTTNLMHRRLDKANTVRIAINKN